jgi:hypothetical protein
MVSKRPGLAFSFNIFEHIIGDSVRAIIPEISTEPASVRANSVNREPVTPPIRAIGEYTAPRVMVMEITGIAISLVPMIAALNGERPFLI